MACTDMTVQEVALSHSVADAATARRVDLDVGGVEVACAFRWRAEGPFLDVSGDGEARSAPDSSISLGLEFLSPDYAAQPPTDVNVVGCDSGLQIKELEVQDDGLGVFAFIVNTLENFLRGTIESELDDVICEQLRTLGEEGGALDEFLTTLADQINIYFDEDGDAAAIAVDPLAAEANAQVPRDEDGNPLWVNFLDLQSLSVDLIGQELTQLAETVMGDINEFVRNNVLDEEGFLVVDPSTVAERDDDAALFDLFGRFAFYVRSVSIAGLDSFQEANVVDPIGNYTLDNSFVLEYLTLVLETEMVMQQNRSDAENNVVAPPPVETSFDVAVTVKDVAVDFALFLGINMKTLGSIPLGSVIFSENIFPCALSAVDEAELTMLSVSAKEIVAPEVSNFSNEDAEGSDALNDVLTSAIEALFSMYEGALLRALPGFFETSLRDALNGYIDGEIDEDDACPPPDSSLDGLVDYRDLFLPEDAALALGGRGGAPYGDVFPALYGFLDDLLANGNLSWLDAFLAQVTGFQSSAEEGEVVLAGDLVNHVLDVSVGGLNAMIKIVVSDIKVSNLEAGFLELLQPLSGEANELNNSVSMGVAPAEPLRFSLTLLIEGRGEELDVSNEVELSLSLEDIQLILQLLAQMMEASFVSLPLGDAFNMYCWLDTIVKPALDKYGFRVGESDIGLVITDLIVAVAQAQLDMVCIDCSSSMLINDVEQAMQSPGGIEDTTETVNLLLDFGIFLLQSENTQSSIDRLLHEAAYRCPSSPSYQEDFAGLEYQEVELIEEPSNYSFLFAIIGVIAVVGVCAAVTVFSTRWIVRRRHERWWQSLSGKQKVDVERMQQTAKQKEQDMNRRMTSLLLSRDVPLVVRLSIPVVLVGNIALFLSGHLNLGGAVSLSGSFAGDQFEVDGFFEFSVLQTTIDMWNAGARTLAILIAIFSGVWPYTKQLLTLVIWIAPPRFLGWNRRGSFLHWLDVLAKWSMVDVFVLLITIASFRISVESPSNLRFLPEGLYTINMLVVPMWGLYANMIAQVLSQISSHIIIHYHRQTVAAAAESEDIEEVTNINANSLSAHQFRLDYEASTKHAVIRKGVNRVFIFLVLSFIIIVICGCFLASFTIEVLGLVGLAVESGNQFEQAKIFYSVFSLASMITNQGRYLGTASDLVGLGAFSSLLVITVFIVPLAQAASLLALWFAPMTTKQRAKKTILTEILSAWQYMEVYVLSIIITAWQLSGVSEFMINAYCDDLEDTFRSLAQFGIISSDDAQCFQVNGTVEAGSWLLVTASLVLCILNHFVGAASEQKSLDDLTPAEQRLPGANECSKANEKGSDSQDVTCIVSPISSRFTDYYHFATIHRTEEECSEIEVLEATVNNNLIK